MLSEGTRFNGLGLDERKVEFVGIFKRIRGRLRRKEYPRRLSIEPPQPLPVRPSTSFATFDFGLTDRYSDHPGQGLTPRTIVSIYREAEVGVVSRQCDLFDDIIESDGHLRSLFEGRTSDVCGKEWICQAGGTTPADVMAAQKLEAALRECPNFDDLLEHLLTSLRYGWAAAEIDWGLTDNGWCPVWFRAAPHRRFRFDEKDNPRLLTPAEQQDGIELERGKWIFERLPGRVIASAGLMRTCSWWALFKRLSVRDWVVFGERFGIPYVTGEYAETASDEDKTTLKTAVQSLGKDGSAIFSEACKIAIHSVESGGRSNDVQGALVALCNNEMSKVIAGATLTSGEGTSTGSYALGKVHQSRAFSLTLRDASRLGTVFARDIGGPFVLFNGMAARPPLLYVHVMPEMDPLTRAQVADIFVNKLGGELDEDQLRREFQFKAPTGGALKGVPKPEPGSPTIPPPAQ